jgi:DNA-binding protein Fis
MDTGDIQLLKILLARVEDLKTVERLLIEAVMYKYFYNKTRAAKAMGISVRTLRYKINGAQANQNLISKPQDA